MQHLKIKKDQTRRRILDAAAHRFREDGIDGSGIAAIMSDAGLTNGAFYGHFESKEELVREAMVSEKKEQIAEWKAVQADEGFEAALRNYLSPAHRDNVSLGCSCAALLSEIARQPLETRAAYSDLLKESISTISNHIAPEDPKSRRANAMAVVAIIVGALQMSRVMTDDRLSLTILESAVKAALVLGKNDL